MRCSHIQLPECFNQWWDEKLSEQLIEKRQKWSCDKSSVFDRDKVVSYAAQQFKRDFSEVLQDWLQTEAIPNILKPTFTAIEDVIQFHITAIRSELVSFNEHSGSSSSSFDWAFNDLKFQNVDDGNVNAMGGFGGVALAAAAIALPGILLPIIIGSLVGGFGLGTLMGLKDSLFDAVFQNCCTTLGESSDKLYDSLIEQIVSSVDMQISEFDESLDKLLAISHARLKQLDRGAAASDLGREQDRQFVTEQLQTLNLIRQDVEKIVS